MAFLRQKLNVTAGMHPSTRLHDVRHAVATELGRRGVHPVIVSAVLGHASPAFTHFRAEVGSTTFTLSSWASLPFIRKLPAAKRHAPAVSHLLRSSVRAGRLDWLAEQERRRKCSYGWGAGAPAAQVRHPARRPTHERRLPLPV